MEKKTKKDIMEEVDEMKQEVSSLTETSSQLLKQLKEVIRLLGEENSEEI